MFKELKVNFYQFDPNSYNNLSAKYIFEMLKTIQSNGGDLSLPILIKNYDNKDQFFSNIYELAIESNSKTDHETYIQNNGKPYIESLYDEGFIQNPFTLIIDEGKISFKYINLMDYQKPNESSYSKEIVFLDLAESNPNLLYQALIEFGEKTLVNIDPFYHSLAKGEKTNLSQPYHSDYNFLSNYNHPFVSILSYLKDTDKTFDLIKLFGDNLIPLLTNHPEYEKTVIYYKLKFQNVTDLDSFNKSTIEEVLRNIFFENDLNLFLSLVKTNPQLMDKSFYINLLSSRSNLLNTTTNLKKFIETTQLSFSDFYKENSLNTTFKIYINQLTDDLDLTDTFFDSLYDSEEIITSEFKKQSPSNLLYYLNYDLMKFLISKYNIDLTNVSLQTLLRNSDNLLIDKKSMVDEIRFLKEYSIQSDNYAGYLNQNLETASSISLKKSISSLKLLEKEFGDIENNPKIYSTLMMTAASSNLKDITTYVESLDPTLLRAKNEDGVFYWYKTLGMRLSNRNGNDPYILNVIKHLNQSLSDYDYSKDPMKSILFYFHSNINNIYDSIQNKIDYDSFLYRTFENLEGYENSDNLYLYFIKNYIDQYIDNSSYNSESLHIDKLFLSNNDVELIVNKVTENNLDGLNFLSYLKILNQKLHDKLLYSNNKNNNFLDSILYKLPAIYKQLGGSITVKSLELDGSVTNTTLKELILDLKFDKVNPLIYEAIHIHEVHEELSESFLNITPSSKKRKI